MINNNFSILFFTEIEFLNMTISIESSSNLAIILISLNYLPFRVINIFTIIKQESLIIGAYEKNNSLTFREVVFDMP